MERRPPRPPRWRTGHDPWGRLMGNVRALVVSTWSLQMLTSRFVLLVSRNVAVL
jgi:hypothetical protein